MPFRAKVKKALGRPALNTDGTEQRTDVRYYKPDEVPASKYRGPYDQDHQDLLHAFSFSDAFGTAKSPVQGACSPRDIFARSRTTTRVPEDGHLTEENDASKGEKTGSRTNVPESTNSESETISSSESMQSEQTDDTVNEPRQSQRPRDSPPPILEWNIPSFEISKSDI